MHCRLYIIGIVQPEFLEMGSRHKNRFQRLSNNLYTLRLLPLSSIPALADIDLDLDLGLFDVLALLDTGICVRWSRQGLVRNLFLQFLVITALTELVDTRVVDLWRTVNKPCV